MFSPLLLLAAVVFHKDIEPLLQKHCQQCHRPGEAAPMPLLTYEQVRPWAKAMRQAVMQGSMPPWHADPAVGKFANDSRLPQEAIDAFRQWVDGGAPRGREADAPKPLRFTDGWTIGEPDAVFEMPVDFEIPAKGDLDYIHFAVPTNFTEDRWIERMEVRPGNRASVHHIGVYIRRKESTWLPQLTADGKGLPLRDRTKGRSAIDEHFAMYLPGYGGEILEPGQARKIPAGADLIFQLHYVTTGKPAKDRSRIGFVFAKQPVRELIHTVPVGDPTIVIPPGEAEYKSRANFFVSMPLRVLGIAPHMHLRGKSFACDAILPDKSRQALLSVPRYDRNWQRRYVLASPPALEKGSWIQCRAVFDNSANNPWNPDPTATVRWGDQTRDEMMVGYVDVALPPDAQPERFYVRPK